MSNLKATTKTVLGKKLLTWDVCEIIDEQARFLIEQAEENGEDVPTMEEAQNSVYSDEDIFSIQFDMFKDGLNEVMEKKNISDCYQVSGSNMGWRHLDGEGVIQAEDAGELLQKILPKTSDVTLNVFNTSRGFAIKCYHHDAPTGETYYIKPIAHSTYSRITG